MISTILQNKDVNQANKLGKVAYIGNNNEPNRISTINWLIQNGISVDCFGQHTNPVGDKIELLKRYSATICFENSYFPGYATEKPIHGYLSDCISIYMGGGDPLLNINEKSGFIRIEPGIKKDIATIKEIVYSTSNMMFAPLFEEQSITERVNQIKQQIRKCLKQFHVST